MNRLGEGRQVSIELASSDRLKQRALWIHRVPRQRRIRRPAPRSRTALVWMAGTGAFAHGRDHPETAGPIDSRGGEPLSGQSEQSDTRRRASPRALVDRPRPAEDGPRIRLTHEEPAQADAQPTWMLLWRRV